MGKDDGKPGVMLYFDTMPVLKMLSDEQRGKLFLGILCYAREGVDLSEDFDREIRIAWALIKPHLDRDDENYYKKVENARRSVEKREARRKKINNFLAESVTLSPGIRRTLQEMVMPEEEGEEQTPKEPEPAKKPEPVRQPEPVTDPMDPYELRRQEQIRRLQQSGY